MGNRKWLGASFFTAGQRPWFRGVAVLLCLCFLLGARCDFSPIFVIPSNTDPVADPGPDQNALAGDEVVLDGSGSFDPDGDPLFFSWEQVEGPVVLLTSPDEPITTFFADVPGTYLFDLTVDDGLGGIDTATVQVDAVP